MAPVEKLQAAIEKLETKRAASSSQIEFWKQYNPLYGERYGASDERGENVARFDRFADADLFETLHRTIDAQVTILQACVESVPIWVEDGATEAEVTEDLERELALADAILGES